MQPASRTPSDTAGRCHPMESLKDIGIPKSFLMSFMSLRKEVFQKRRRCTSGPLPLQRQRDRRPGQLFPGQHENRCQTIRHHKDSRIHPRPLRHLRRLSSREEEAVFVVGFPPVTFPRCACRCILLHLLQSGRPDRETGPSPVVPPGRDRTMGHVSLRVTGYRWNSVNNYLSLTFEACRTSKLNSPTHIQVDFASLFRWSFFPESVL